MRQRYHALDGLRASMMLLGIILHAAISYVPWDTNPYLFKDERQSLILSVLVFAIHIFRMPAFFVMAGFFTVLLIQRKGLEGMLRNRMQRVGLVFLVFWPLLTIAVAFTYLLNIHYLEHSTLGVDLGLLNKYRPEGTSRLSTLHLWFLYYLILLYVLFVPIYFISWKLPRLKGMAMFAGSWCLRSPLGVIVLALFTAIPGSFYPYGIVDVNTSFVPGVSQILYYGIFFTIGLCIHENLDLLDEYGKKFWVILSFSVVATFISYVYASGIFHSGEGGRFYLTLTISLASWFWVYALIGLFQRYLSKPSKTMRYLSDASYWIYLVHLIPCMLLPVWLHDKIQSAELKFAITVVVASLFCVSTYQLFVRPTFVGQFLNGRRYPRPTKAEN